MYCMQFVMSVSVVSWCGVVVFLGAMYMLAMVMSLKCFVCILRSCISVLSVLLLFAMIRSVVKSFKVPDVEVAAARMSNESALTRMTDSTPI